MIVHLNGRWLDEADAAIPISDRGFLYGEAVFESARLFRGAYFRLGEHLARLRASALVMGFDVPDAALLSDIAGELVRHNALADGSLRITVSRGAGDRPGLLLATLAPIAADWQARATRGWSVVTSSVRRPSVSAVPAQLKGIGRPWAVLARNEARSRGADDALLLSPDGFITEGPTWNVFWRRGSTLFTPGLAAGVLGGITRAAVLELAPRRGLRIEEVMATHAELATAAEIFATMSSVGIVSFNRLDGRPLRPTRAAARALQRDYWRLVGRECGGE